MGISRLNPSEGGIPYGNTAGRPANPGIGRLYSNGELQRLELYTGATYGWQNIVAETPGVTGYTGTVIETNTTNTITITGTNFAGGASVSLIGSDGTEYNATSVTVSNLTAINATFGEIPANKEPYDIRVTNPSNLYGVYYDILTVNDKPIWTTSAGLLGSFATNESVSIQLAATDEENNSLTYSLVSGLLPTGLNLSSSGLISGTNSGTAGTTYNFTISVSDSSNIAQSRAFSISVPYPTVSGGTLSSDSTYYYRTFTSSSNLIISNNIISADILTIAGGGGGAGGNGNSGGGGAGGVVYNSGVSLSSISYSVAVGSPGSGGIGQGVTGSNGTNSNITGGSLSLTAAVGGGGGGGWNTNNGGQNGGSGGGAGGNISSGGAFGSSIQTGPATAYYGNRGGTGISTSPYPGGGGGGAGSVGGTGSVQSGTGYAIPGNGGSGTNAYSSWLSAITPQMTGVSGWGNATSTGYIAAGGAGGSEIVNTVGQGSGGGVGGGGNRGAAQNGSYGATPGITNTGSGGGSGGMYTGSYVDGANGGSGIVIVRYTRASVGG